MFGIPGTRISISKTEASCLIDLPHCTGQDEPHVVIVADRFRLEAVCWTQRHRKQIALLMALCVDPHYLATGMRNATHEVDARRLFFEAFTKMLKSLLPDHVETRCA
jgi:hypothetical protein